MALNESYNGYSSSNSYKKNDNSNKNNFPTVYSPYRMNNIEGFDPTALSFDYWRHFLKISIIPCSNAKESIESNYNVKPQYDTKSAGSIYLNHNSARILYMELRKFIADPTAYKSVGVPSGSSIITISNGSEFGVDCPCVVIRLVGEDGTVQSSYAYQIKKNHYYSVRNYDAESGKFDKNTDDFNFIELEQLSDVLKTYIESMTYAYAYSVIDSNKFDNSRLNTKINSIASKLGISFGNGSTGKSGGSSYFSKSEGNTNTSYDNYESGTLDDLEEA